MCKHSSHLLFFVFANGFCKRLGALNLGGQENFMVMRETNAARSLVTEVSNHNLTGTAQPKALSPFK
eukprot:3706050-Amphidinium_carterae.1